MELSLALAVLVAYAILSKKRRLRSLPPSPNSHLLFGHLFMLPTSEEHIVYRDIAKQLNSDIISFTALGQVIIVLNSIESATELLSKRGAIYSDRPQLPILKDEKLAGWGKNTGFLAYGERWKKQRYRTQAILEPNASGALSSKMTKQARLSMRRLLSRPEGAAEELRWMTAAIMLSCIYGYEASYPDDELVRLIEISNDQLCEAAIPNTHVPSWAPGAAWKRRANEWRLGKDRVVNEPLEWTKSQMAAGVASSSISETLLTEMATSEIPDSCVEEEEDVIRWVAGTLYSAGADTTVATETNFVLAMVLHPEVQKKAQAELDRVLGGRLPELSDRESLPYLDAVMKEVMRWRPVVPMGLPRATSKEDVYGSYLIPKGAIV
ncbi:cytochrome P450 family protein [Ceratobasidium sp. AG-Ba]|nr:cytochrome P450 family protein [Ceratobasidium sp. AG-Ba]